ncbi:hypothetical protein GC175_17135 [bacterium]|nr:hypothetical protein [bacterium]
MITTERVAQVTLWLARGEAFTVAELAIRTGMTWEGAYRMLCRMERKIPLWRDEVTKKWALMEDWIVHQ